MATMQKITSNLWFNNQAEEATSFYVSIFKNSAIKRVTRYGKEGVETHKMPEGMVMTVDFQLEGQSFVALNGGPQFPFTPAVSFIVSCDSQEEVDHYWDKLSEGGDEKAQMCGWLSDKFGLSWQIVPVALMKLMSNPDPEQARRAMHAMLKMKKIDIAALERAAAGQDAV